MRESKNIESLRDAIAAREAEVNSKLEAIEARLVGANLKIRAYALRGVKPRFGLALQWQEDDGEWSLSIRHKSNTLHWALASIEDRTYAIKLIDPLLEELVENGMRLATAINAPLPKG